MIIKDDIQQIAELFVSINKKLVAIEEDLVGVKTDISRLDTIEYDLAGIKLMFQE